MANLRIQLIEAERMEHLVVIKVEISSFLAENWGVTTLLPFNHSFYLIIYFS